MWRGSRIPEVFVCICRSPWTLIWKSRSQAAWEMLHGHTLSVETETIWLQYSSYKLMNASRHPGLTFVAPLSSAASTGTSGEARHHLHRPFQGHSSSGISNIIFKARSKVLRAGSDQYFGRQRHPSTFAIPRTRQVRCLPPAMTTKRNMIHAAPLPLFEAMFSRLFRERSVASAWCPSPRKSAFELTTPACTSHWSSPLCSQDLRVRFVASYESSINRSTSSKVSSESDSILSWLSSLSCFVRMRSEHRFKQRKPGKPNFRQAASSILKCPWNIETTTDSPHSRP